MKKAEVFIGRTYWAKVSGRVVPVLIDSEAHGKGWNATNTKTGRTVRIMTAARLRGAYTQQETTPAANAGDSASVVYSGLYAVCASLQTKTADGWARTTQLPTFFLDASVQGIVDTDHAERIARDIVGENSIISVEKI